MSTEDQSGDAAADELRLDQFLPYRLSLASNLVSETIAATYRSHFGLTIPEWRIVAVIAEGEGMTQRDIVHRTRMDKVTVSRAAKVLVGRGLVARQVREEDRRSHALVLTDQGKELHRRIGAQARAMERAIFGRFEAEELAAFEAMLRRIDAAALEVLEGKG
ncbi:MULTISPECIES: MarR family winged helix-turn-helix transcriptional regulator [Novosphingopyxis]|uniref:MarR family winged helix-turn-helix transcriptional regulator n=1 Tax=Novosphingopyxis TaxID=2709686 RepID=UPI001650FC91|nr:MULTISPECIES: MarR family transcriptional regulator [Novosphingopyxis]MBH9538720.1 MarR family transcriptional regulator [Novosphingopyxis sp. YJ-S2-01]